MTRDAQQIWNDLAAPWQLAFEEAWRSWTLGSLGIGAVLVDPASGEVVSQGRNRTAEDRSEAGVLASNFMAHAEMNAIAALPRFKADGLHLYTTLEPCLMCASTAIFMHVDTVLFASADPYFADLDDLWDHHPYSQKWKTNNIGPLDNPMADFSMLLHMTGMKPDNKAFTVLAAHTPALVELAFEIVDDGTLGEVRDTGGTVETALERLLPRLSRP